MQLGDCGGNPKPLATTGVATRRSPLLVQSRQTVRCQECWRRPTQQLTMMIIKDRLINQSINQSIKQSEVSQTFQSMNETLVRLFLLLLLARVNLTVQRDKQRNQINSQSTKGCRCSMQSSRLLLVCAVLPFWVQRSDVAAECCESKLQFAELNVAPLSYYLGGEERGLRTHLQPLKIITS